MPQQVGKNKQGHGYKFADLNKVMAFLEAQGIQYDQTSRWNSDARHYEIVTRLKYLGEETWGDWEAVTPIIAGQRFSREGKRILTDMQEYQSAETSARRFSLILAANLVTSDDDAASAGGSETTAATPGTVSAEQFTEIGKLLRSIGRIDSNKKAGDALTELCGRKITGTGELSMMEASNILRTPKQMVTEIIDKALAETEETNKENK